MQMPLLHHYAIPMHRLDFMLTIDPQQPILDILADMIAYDGDISIRTRPSSAGINLGDIPNVGLD